MPNSIIRPDLVPLRSLKPGDMFTWTDGVRDVLMVVNEDRYMVLKIGFVVEKVCWDAFKDTYVERVYDVQIKSWSE